MNYNTLIKKREDREKRVKLILDEYYSNFKMCLNTNKLEHDLEKKIITHYYNEENMKGYNFKNCNKLLEIAIKEFNFPINTKIECSIHISEMVPGEIYDTYLRTDLYY